MVLFLNIGRPPIKEFHGVGPKIAAVVAYEAFGMNHIPVDVHVLRFSKFFGWCCSNASAEECQEDIKSWMPTYYWHMLNSTIGSFSQLSVSNKDLINSEMVRMCIGRDVIPQMNIYNKLVEYYKTFVRKKRNHDKVSPQRKV
jgi:endonuclease III